MLDYVQAEPSARGKFPIQARVRPGYQGDARAPGKMLYERSYVYIYIYREREREGGRETEREREGERGRERERERERERACNTETSMPTACSFAVVLVGVDCSVIFPTVAVVVVNQHSAATAVALQIVVALLVFRRFQKHVSHRQHYS